MGDSAPDQDARRGRVLVERAVRNLPVPPARPERSSRQRLGLHLLQASLRWDHVDRVSETLSLVESSHLTRRVDIDVDLSRLSEDRRRGLSLEWWRHPADRPALWVPVARHDRRALGPVTCVDGDGAVLPRMTGREVNRLMAAAVIAVLRQLRSHPPPGGHPRPAPPPRRIGEPGRWLVEAALSAIIEDGRIDWPETGPDRGDDPWLAEALTWLQMPRTFFRLVHDTAQDQVVVVRLPSEAHQVRVSYDAPELQPVPQRPERRARRRPVSRLVPGLVSHLVSHLVSTQHVSVVYRTTIPAHLDSHHVTLQVPSQMAVRHMLMISDADRRAVSALAADARYLAAHGGPGGSDGSDGSHGDRTGQAHEASLLDYEARSAAARLREVALRRREDALEYGRYLHDRRLARPAARHRDPWSLPELDDDVPPGQGPHAEWAGRIAAVIKDLDLDVDLQVDNDPRESAGHVQWRRHRSGLGPASYRSVTASVVATLVDAPPSGASRLLAALVANAVLVTVLFGILLGAPGAGRAAAGAAAETVLTLMLVVPGLVIALISLQQRRRLRSLVVLPQHYIGWPVIAANVLLAVVTVGFGAVDPGTGAARWLVVAVTGLVALQWVAVATLAAVLVGGWLVGRRRIPPFRVLPEWLRRAGRSTSRFSVRPTLWFDGGSRPLTRVTTETPDNGRYIPRATLVDITLRAVDTAGIRFRVRHSLDPNHGSGSSAEIFTTDIDDIRQSVSTGRLDPDTSDALGGDDLVTVLKDRNGDDWTGVVRTEAAFFFTFSDKVDLLFTVAPGAWSMRAEHPVAARVTALLCDVLAEVGRDPDYRPVTFVRSPSVGFDSLPTGDGAGPGMPAPADAGEVDPLLARGVNLRVTVGLDDRDHRSRQDLLTRVIGLARRHGAALHVAGRQFGTLTGRWVPVQGLCPPSVVPLLARPVETPGGRVTVHQVTALGPARQGSFLAVLASMRDAGVTLAAVTALSMQGVSVLLLVTRGTTPVPAGDYPLDEYLRHHAPGTAIRVRPAAAGYRCLVSDAVPQASSDRPAGHPIYASWEIRDLPADSPTGDRPFTSSVWERLLAAVLEDPQVRDAQVEYHRSRRTSSTGMVERLKIAVVLSAEADDAAGTVADRLDALCARVFDGMIRDGQWARDSSGEDAGDGPAGTPRMARLRVEARERWLGSWIDDPR